MDSPSGILTVNLSAIQENWRRIGAQLSPEARVAAVIKADAYGLGADKVGPALAAIGCRTFFVATIEEGLAARRYLPSDAEIYVLGGARPGAEYQFLSARLMPVLFSLEAVNRWRSFCREQRIPLPCALKVNTGMTRLGLDEEEFAGLCQQSPGADLNVRLIMSHLACADEPGHPLNGEQLARFRVIAALGRDHWPEARLSLANSSGIYLGKDWQFDLVRPGAALYGINPSPGCESPVLPVVSLALPVLQKRQLRHPAAIGYGAGVSRDSAAYLMVAAGGYADGLHAILGKKKGEGMIAGLRLPVIGRISMDATIFDASDLDDETRKHAKMIEVINDQLTLDYWTACNRALGYELLTSLAARRYQRHYLFDDDYEGNSL